MLMGPQRQQQLNEGAAVHTPIRMACETMADLTQTDLTAVMDRDLQSAHAVHALPMAILHPPKHKSGAP